MFSERTGRARPSCRRGNGAAPGLRQTTGSRAREALHRPAALALVGPAAGTPGATIPESILQRILGRTRRQRGDIEGAEQALETSLALAVRADAPFQQAQTLSELAQLRGDGTDPDADAIFERLGVVGSVDRPWSGLAGRSMPSR